jgi:sensor histidine kinase YesM
MLLIPLVENAFKHGVSLTAESRITIQLSCDEKVTTFVVRNSIHQKNKGIDEQGSGIGLNNIQKRLQLIYSNRHKFHSGVQGNEFVAELSIQHQ